MKRQATHQLEKSKQRLLLGTSLRVSLVTIFLSSCSNSTLVKSHNLSASSVAYTKTVNELLDETIKHVIDVDSQELLRTRVGTNPKKMLKDKNKAMKALIDEINNLRQQISLMNNYFVSLQALADSTVKDDAGINLGRISSRINYINNRPRSADDSVRIDKLFSEQEEGYISQMTSMIVGSYYAARIEAALRRDAPIIAKQMLIQEKQLKLILGILQNRLDTGNRIHLTDKVIIPYAATKDLSFDRDAWVSNRRKWFQLEQAAPIFADVQEAQKTLRLAWEDILRGKKDIGVVDIMLTDVNDFLGTLHALDQSRKKESYRSHPLGE